MERGKLKDEEKMVGAYELRVFSLGPPFGVILESLYLAEKMWGEERV